MKYKCTQCGEVCEVKTTTKMLPNRCVIIISLKLYNNL